MNKFLVIGSNSFTGACFIDFLLNKESDCRIVGLSRSEQKSALFLPYLTNPQRKRFDFVKTDLNHDLALMNKIIDDFRPDYIVNFAAQSEVMPSWENPDHWYRTNVLSTQAFYTALKDKKYIKKILHTSSPEVYGNCQGNITEDSLLNPSTPYAASKAGGDLSILPLIKNFQLPVVFIRATNIYGKHQQLFKIIPRSAIYIMMEKVIELHGGGQAIKSYLHSYDICHGTYLATLKGRPGEIYHLSPDDGGISIRDIISMVCQEMHVDFTKATVNVGERLGQDAAYIIDSSKARKELGWKCEISREQGVSEVIKWVKDNFHEIRQQPLQYIHNP